MAHHTSSKRINLGGAEKISNFKHEQCIDMYFFLYGDDFCEMCHLEVSSGGYVPATLYVYIHSRTGKNLHNNGSEQKMGEITCRWHTVGFCPLFFQIIRISATVRWHTDMWAGSFTFPE